MNSMRSSRSILSSPFSQTFRRFSSFRHLSPVTFPKLFPGLFLALFLGLFLGLTLSSPAQEEARQAQIGEKAKVAKSEVAPNAEAERKSKPELNTLPYLQNPTPDGMSVYLVSTNASDVRVEYTDKFKQSITVNAKALRVPKTDKTVWKARLDKLKPGATYSYRVLSKIESKDPKDAKNGNDSKDDKDVISDTYTFTTPNPSAQETCAIAFNDLHNRKDTLAALMTQIKPEDYDYTLLLGDLWDDPITKDNAAKFFNTLSDYIPLLDASNKPVFFIRGNHETRGNFSRYVSYAFDLPNNKPQDEFAQQNAYYDFHFGPIWFISPDAGEDGDKRAELFQAYRSRQAAWLRKIFMQSPSKKAPWRIIATHIPLYNPNGWDQPDALQRWEAILNKEKIDLMIAGHDHSPYLAPKGKEFTLKDREKPITPPYPVLVGGGPGNGTVMLIKADSRNLNVRLLDAKGKELHKVSLQKK